MDEASLAQKLAAEALGTAYIGALVAGAIVGAAAIIGVLSTAARDAGLGVATYSGDVSAVQAIFAEFVGTFVLVFTVFGVVHRTASAAFAYIAISKTRGDQPPAPVAVPAQTSTAA
jgi:glycerol uptake facilitator-like aquaporin